MSTVQSLPATREIVYPDSDGDPMADNTKQADVMVWLKTNFDELFAGDPGVFVAMDLLWYPVQGDNKTRMAPDVLIAFGPKKGDRGSYKQWDEGTAPQVVFEIWSPGNRAGEMFRKYPFYETYGVEEYYLYNPDTYDFSGWFWHGETRRLRLIDPIDGFVSPRLGVTFDAPGDRELAIYRPDGSRFLTPLEKNAERQQIVRERDEAKAKNDLLIAKLREMGGDPSTLT